LISERSFSSLGCENIVLAAAFHEQSHATERKCAETGTGFGTRNGVMSETVAVAEVVALFEEPAHTRVYVPLVSAVNEVRLELEGLLMFLLPLRLVT